MRSVKQHTDQKGEEVFYASLNKGKIKRVKKKKKRS